MYQVLLAVNLLICVALIGLVLLQRSEGGALGVGGGGGGSLMSGRGAADALAKMTGLAGGLFLICSLVLTVLAGAARTGAERSILDSVPRPAQTAPLVPTPAPAAPAQRESEAAPLLAPASASATQPAPTGPTAPSPNDAVERARPIAPATAQPANTTPPPPASAQRTTAQPAPAPPPAQPRAAQNPPPRTQRPVQTTAESVETLPPEPALRPRAGPDQ